MAFVRLQARCVFSFFICDLGRRPGGRGEPVDLLFPFVLHEIFVLHIARDVVGRRGRVHSLVSLGLSIRRLSRVWAAGSLMVWPVASGLESAASGLSVASLDQNAVVPRVK